MKARERRGPGSKFIGVERRSRPSEGGFALLTVLFVLLFLLVFCAPFLLTAKNADRASAHLAERAQARLALDGAARHARAVLGQTHSALDPTVYEDSLEELAVDNAFPEGFLDANDANGVMWDLDAIDLAGQLDLNSVPPQVVASLIGAATRLSAVTKEGETELSVADTSGFAPSGYLWIQGEVVHYEGIEGNTFVGCTRSVGVTYDDGGQAIPDGPLPAEETYGIGTTVLDERAFALVRWRTRTLEGEAHFFDTAEQAMEAAALARSGELGADALRAVLDQASVYAGVRGGSEWQRPVRLTRPLFANADQQIFVDDPRWLGPGATVKISDQYGSEVFFLARMTSVGAYLDRAVARNFDAWTTTVSVLARRPVNLNTAPGDVIETLFRNLQMQGMNSRVTRSEARELAALVVASRPFDGMEDFLRRVLLPASGLEPLPEDARFVPESFSDDGMAAMIDEADALALYANGLNANDRSLAFSTMPYAFTSRDVFALELRSSVNAPSGVERVTLAADRVELVVPQQELFAVWTRQEDFDESLRLGRNAPWWGTGPLSTTRYDGTTQPPSRLNAHFGTRGGRPFLPGQPFVATTGGSAADEDTVQHVFASREDDGWVQLAPSRRPELLGQEGRIQHFDHETRALEGRYLPDETIRLSTADDLVQWTGTGAPEEALLRAFSFSAWIQPRSLDDSVLLDLGEADDEADRVWLGFEEGDLVLRVFDGYGDHPATDLNEYGEVRYALTQDGADPGMPVDTWHHVDVDVRGNRPDQISMVVNGSTQGVRTLGMTRLSAAIGADDMFIPVDSTEGFPEEGVLRIGDELIEYTSRSAGGFSAQFQATGQRAGFGGRGARARFSLAADGTLTGLPPTTLFYDETRGIATFHDLGTPVSLYGYSLAASETLTPAQGALPEALGPFRVAEVVGVVGSPAEGDIITVAGGVPPVGLTVLGLRAGQRRITGLRLADADTGQIAGDYLDAFPPSGGYVAFVQLGWQVGTSTVSDDREALGGIEVVHYGSRAGNVISDFTRGDQVRLENVPANVRGLLGGTRAFVVDWQNAFWDGGGPNGQPMNQIQEASFFVVPLSVPTGSSDIPWPRPPLGESSFAQLTEFIDAETTEWVRYDELGALGGDVHLVRNDPDALRALHSVLTGFFTSGPIGGVLPPDGGGGGGGGGGGSGGPIGTGGLTGGDDGSGETLVFGPPPAQGQSQTGGQTQTGGDGGGLGQTTPGGGGGGTGAPAPTGSALGNGPQWQTELGASPTDMFPIARAASSALRLRGVLGTNESPHAAGTVVLPVVRFKDRGPDRGRPGRYDSIFLADALVDDLGFAARVHRAHWPARESPAYNWPGTWAAPAVQPYDEVAAGEYDIDGALYVAFEEVLPVPLEPVDGDPDALRLPFDSRLLSRIVKFPSGERPRLASKLGVGSGFESDINARIPSAVIDEITYGTANLGIGYDESAEYRLQGAQFVLAARATPSSEQLLLDPARLRVAGSTEVLGAVLDDLPANGGLLRIGSELIAYESIDAGSGVVTIGFSGRGLLGSVPQPHEVGEPVTWLEGWPVTTLSGSITASDGTIPVTDFELLPDQGTVRIDDELLHYTRKRSGSLEMPRSSKVAGALDELGDGIFRGRFGTDPTAHQAGAPVILFPFRYWDRWSDRADVPELAYFGFEVDQPSAWWDGVYWEAELPSQGGVEVGVLQRTDPDVPWDADPSLHDGLTLMWEGEEAGGMVPVAAQADRIEWRIFARYNPGAFDPIAGLSHAWKETPRLRRIATSFFAPQRTLRSVLR